MAKALVFTLVCMVALTFLSVITGNDLISVSVEASYTFESLNGTISDLDITGSMNLSTLQDAILWISVIGGVAVASGIAILGSGLNDNATKWLVYMVFFVSSWSILSVLSFPLILEIEGFGSILYIGFTVVYGISAIMYIGGTT